MAGHKAVSRREVNPKWAFLPAHELSVDEFAGEVGNRLLVY